MLIIICIYYITCCYSAQRSKSFCFILIFLLSKTNTVDVMKTRYNSTVLSIENEWTSLLMSIVTI